MFENQMKLITSLSFVDLSVNHQLGEFHDTTHKISEKAKKLQKNNIILLCPL